MADVGNGLRTFLLTRPPVESAVGLRISPEPIEQGTRLPAISYFVIDSESGEDLQGAVGVAHTRIQIDVYAAKRIQANQIADEIRKAIQGFRGRMGGVFVHGVSAGSAARDSTDAPTDGSDVHRYLRSRDYVISHEE